MNTFVSILALTAAPVLAAVLPAALERSLHIVPNGGGMQVIPPTAKAPGTFSNGKPGLFSLPPETGNTVPTVYGARDIDLPFARLFHGKLNYYTELNVHGVDTSVWGSKHDYATQSACGIPANAYFISGVAIHPYFLKYAGLDRYCMQDVCISFWREDGKSDMMLKVTDICTPDSADGVPCLDPMEIKIDRAKAAIIFDRDGNPLPAGYQYPEKVWWFFTKCWADGLIQPAYQNNSNWFAEPFLPNNLGWSQNTAFTQMLSNQASYPSRGWETYPSGLYNTTRVAPPILDWDPENPPSWTPVAGGRGSSLSGWPQVNHPSPPPSSSSPSVVRAKPTCSPKQVLPRPKPTPTSTPPPSNPPGGVAPKFGQCGGIGWRGPTTCVAGTKCMPQAGNQYYSQCL